MLLNSLFWGVAVVFGGRFVLLESSGGPTGKVKGLSIL